MALRKIIKIEGEAFMQTQGGQTSVGHQKASFSAYCKVINFTGDKNHGRINVESTGDGFRSISEYTVPFSIEDDAPNFVKQAYIYLKTLPEFADATDC